MKELKYAFIELATSPDKDFELMEEIRAKITDVEPFWCDNFIAAYGKQDENRMSELVLDILD